MATRHIVLLLCMLANAISYTMRTNLSITIVSMVSEANKTDLDTCLANEENTQRRRLTDDELTFNWTIPSNQSVISGLGNVSISLYSFWLSIPLLINVWKTSSTFFLKKKKAFQHRI